MTTAIDDDFLSGQGVPVDLHDVPAELARLWGPAAEQAGASTSPNPNVTRVVLANLVLFCRQADASRLPGVLEAVAARYPSRIIGLRRDESPGRSLRAEVSALCHLPAPGLPQVCSERIVLRAGPDAVDLLPGAVRPLLEADLPFVLWWTDDPRRDETLFRDLGEECSRLILDLPDPGTDPSALRLGLDPSICRFSRDAVWFGLTRWRELIAQFFDPPCAGQSLSLLDRIRVEAASPAPCEAPRLAVWLLAWLAGQLNWTPGGTPDRAEGRLSATFQGPNGPVAVEILTSVDSSLEEPLIQSVELTTRGSGDEGPERFQLRRESNAVGKVRVEVDSPSHCALPRTVLAPEVDAPRRIAAALESSRNDPPFQHAMPHASWLLGL
ncbi:MAG: glucose-6-phosphate dehydrogenase assembly protein OpcA [Isosphaeraceae bacterium]